MGIGLSHEVLSNGIAKITLTGGTSLDAPSTMAIENEFQALLLSEGGTVIVDLSQLDYMSSYGLRMLLTGAKNLHNGGGALHLASANENIMQIITVAGYDTMFPVHDSVEDALLYIGL